MRVVLDANGPALHAALQTGVFLFKPSLRELRELTGQALPDEASWIAACQHLIQTGQAEVVALSLGEDGAMVISANQSWRSPGLKVDVHTTIGAGDSFLGGWLHGWQTPDTASDAEPSRLMNAFRWAMATAASAVSSYGTALCDPQQVQALLKQVVIERC